MGHTRADKKKEQHLIVEPENVSARHAERGVNAGEGHGQGHHKPGAQTPIEKKTVEVRAVGPQGAPAEAAAKSHDEGKSGEGPQPPREGEDEESEPNHKPDARGQPVETLEKIDGVDEAEDGENREGKRRGTEIERGVSVQETEIMDLGPATRIVTSTSPDSRRSRTRALGSCRSSQDPTPGKTSSRRG